jgi:hypothetical protein
MINTINIPDIIDQILYPESASAVATFASGDATEFDKKLNELVNGAVIDSDRGDSPGKLIVVICYLFISTNIY